MIEIQGKFYEWDPMKSRHNIQKHGVSFKEAATTFQDENALYFDDMPEITDFSKGRKNPFADKIKKEGYSITTVEHYSPEDIANSHFDDTKEIIQALVELMPATDSRRLLAHIKEHYNVPCSPHLWDAVKA